MLGLAYLARVSAIMVKGPSTRRGRASKKARKILKGVIKGVKGGHPLLPLLSLLALHGLPLKFLQLVFLVAGIAPVKEDITSLESFAGQKAVTRAFIRAGHCAVSFEILDNPVMDVLSPEGYALLVSLALRTGCGSFKLTAPVCSTWVWVNRGTSLRSWDRPLGDASKPSVQQAILGGKA